MRASAFVIATLLSPSAFLTEACSSDESGPPGHDASANVGGKSASGGAGPSTGGASVEASAGTGGGSGGASKGGSGGASKGGSAGSAGTPDAGAPEGGTLDGGADGSSGADTLDAKGGTVTGPHGASITAPQGALTSSVSFGIAEDATGAPSLPAGMLALGPIYAFTPHGTKFAKPVTVHVPFDETKLPAGESPLLLKAEPGGTFGEITATRTGATMTASVDTFSWFVAVRDASKGSLRVVIDAEADVFGHSIVTGPAGIVVVAGNTGANLDGQHAGGSNTCFVAKLTALLSFEWVRQFYGCLGNPVIGPTGNIHFVTETQGTPQMLQLSSLDPSGTMRTGFPVDIGPFSFDVGGYSVQQIAVNGQDDIAVLGFQETAPDVIYTYTSHSFLASYSSSGQVQSALGLINYGIAGAVYDYPWAIAYNNAGLWTASDFENRTDNSHGGLVMHYTSGGGVAAGFPIQTLITTVVPPLPFYLGALPATNDVIAVGNTRAANSRVALIRYQDTGTIAQGYPVDLATGSTKAFKGGVNGAVDVDGQGNVFLLAPVNDPADANDADELVVLSYTTAGALRSGYPIHVGNGSNNQTPVAHGVSGIALDDNGALYVVGDDPNTTVATRRSLMIQRMPAP